MAESLTGGTQEAPREADGGEPSDERACRRGGKRAQSHGKQVTTEQRRTTARASRREATGADAYEPKVHGRALHTVPEEQYQLMLHSDVGLNLRTQLISSILD